MESALLAFISVFLGVAGTGDTAENKGQCVGLIEVWLDRWKLPHIWGNASDLLANADRRLYTVTANGPTNYPEPGAVLVWGPSWGGGDGHTAVVVSANRNFVAVFEQNDPVGFAPTVATHTYDGVAGWLAPKSWPA